MHRNYLDGFGGVVIDKSVFHSTKALSEGGVDVIEIETPPNKTDLVRLNDAYGRELHGYEGFTEMLTENLERFNHFYFDEPQVSNKSVRLSGGYAVSFETYCDNDQFRDSFELKENDLYSLCRGRILNAGGQPVFEVGDIQNGNTLKEHALNGIRIDGKTILIRARKSTN